jgi:hypothetical protein
VALVATTVKLADLPAEMVEGSAEMVTVGAIMDTVTVVVAVAVPPAPLAVAV